MAKTLYVVVEHFKSGDAVPVYARFRERGRLAPEGLRYVDSWVTANLERCYQLMETDGIVAETWELPLQGPPGPATAGERSSNGRR